MSNSEIDYNVFTVFDFETNGLLKENDNEHNQNIIPIEISAVSFDNVGNFKTFNCYIRPVKPITSQIEEITGISQKILDYEGINLSEGISRLRDLFTPYKDNNKTYYPILVGHNILKFDLLIYNIHSIEKINNNHPVFDTAAELKAVKMGWKKFNQYSDRRYHLRALDSINKKIRFNLGEACRYYKINETLLRHRAINDVYYTTLVYINQIKDRELIDNNKYKFLIDCCNKMINEVK